MPLRNNLQELLKKRDMNLYQLHQLTGIGYHVLDAHLKNRARQIGHKTIEKICEVLNCSVEDLLTLDEDISKVETPQPGTLVTIPANEEK